MLDSVDNDVDTLPGASPRTLAAQHIRALTTRELAMAGIRVSAGASTLSGAPDMLTSQVATEGARTVLVLRGEADFSAVSALSDALAGAISSGTDVVIDLAELAFIDTAAVRVLAAAQQRLAHRGRTLTFRAPNSVAERMLEMFRLTAVIETVAATRP